MLGLRRWAMPLAALTAFGLVAAMQAQRPGKTKPAPIVRPKPPFPLSEREHVEQMLDRFTYGPRPGEVDRVLAMGAERWFEAQLNPESIPDDVLNRRLADLPTVGMTPPQALAVFPDRPQVTAVAQGKAAMPTDPVQRAVMEVQVAKWNAEQDRKKADGTKAPAPEMSDEEKAAKRKADQESATRIAGELLALPKSERIAALIARPVEDRIVFTANGNLQGQQRNMLFADFTPREREAFQAMSAQVSSTGNLANELAQAHMLRDILSERQLETVMTDLWFNHFNVFIGKDADQWYTASYERDVIRPHALGKFRELLIATATSPAMMIYLDNAQSIGPNSIANGVNPANPKVKRGNRGLNENYGREVMELHTVGVNGGYTQADVTALSAILTGWGVEKPQDGGPFVFEPRRHEPGAKAWFGHCIAEDGAVTTLPKGSVGSRACEAGDEPVTPASMQQGIAALEVLAASPQTARFISQMLAEYFVADNPPPALVARLTQVYLQSDGDIRAMLRAILASPEFNSRQYFHDKVKTPVEFLASAYRATGTDPQNVGSLVNEARVMGMPLYYALPPTGYYLTADHWMNSTALVDRLNFAAQLTAGRVSGQKFDAARLLATGLMSAGSLPSVAAPERTTASADQTRHDSAPMVWIAAPVPANGTAGMPLKATISVGSALAIRVLEQTVTGGPVSPKTDALIDAQLAQQTASANAADGLSLVTGLLLGSPEFQTR